MITKVYREIVDELKKHDIPWRIEEGTRHHKIYVRGRMIGTFCKGQGSKNKDAKNIVSRIRKIVLTDPK
jgi:hypothetical protein